MKIEFIKGFRVEDGMVELGGSQALHRARRLGLIPGPKADHDSKLRAGSNRRRRERGALEADVALMVGNDGRSAQRRAGRIRAGVIKRGSHRR
jgi:hypothetical protein